jgi:hypothetical protein
MATNQCIFAYFGRHIIGQLVSLESRLLFSFISAMTQSVLEHVRPTILSIERIDE